MNGRIWEERMLREAVLGGDEDAWRALYDRCFQRLYTHVWFRTGKNVHRAEEVVQECWMVAVRRIRAFDPDRGSFDTWMRGIADKVLRNKWRRWARRGDAELPLHEAGIPAEEAPAARIAVAEQVAVILAGLPPDYRDVLSAKYGEGRSVAEIAGQRRQSPKAVESLLTRARVAFRRDFRQLDEE